MTTRPRQVELPRLNRPALFEQLDYRPHRGQLPIHRSTAQRRVVACGTRFGKSTLGAAETIAEMMTPRESSLGWVVGPSLQLTGRIFERVSHLVMTHLSHLVIQHQPRQHTLRMLNLAGGISELCAMSADRPHALLGGALDYVVVDESAHIRDNVWSEHLSARLVDRNGRALILGTPQGPGWFHDEFKRGRHGTDPAYESWQLPTWENPFINKELIEPERARLGDELFAQQYEAKFLGVPPEPCSLCGGPSPTVSGLTVYFGDEEPRHCVACGREVDKRGRTVVALCEGEEVPVNRLYVNDGSFDDEERETIYRDFGPGLPE
jgi:hypothetical protein